MVVSTFFVTDKNNREKFFEESFLLANVKSDIVLGMPFLTMSNADVDFQAWDLQWRSYTTRDVFLTIKQVELIGKKEFVATALDPKHEVFVIYVAVLNVDLGDAVYPLRKAQIAHLKADETPTKVLSEYADFADLFSPKLAVKLSKHTGINDHAIELEDNW